VPSVCIYVGGKPFDRPVLVQQMLSTQPCKHALQFSYRQHLAHYGSFLLASERNGQIISVRHQGPSSTSTDSSDFVSLDAPL